MSLLRSVLILSSLLVVGYSISCYTCKKLAVDGVYSDSNQPECTEEHKKECDDGIDYCVSGNLEQEYGTLIQRQDYFKDCGHEENMRNCDEYEQVALDTLKKKDPDMHFKLTKCNLVSCTEDLCNTQSADELKNLKNLVTNEGEDTDDEDKDRYVSSGRTVAVNTLLMAVIAAYFYF